MDREIYGPEFDDRLIKLVKENAAIYDVSHPHYRRTPVRMTIWDNIAKELGAPSRFLQTKWKNIRYNYLQEQKCLETGTINTNIRKRRFTEDLSFLKHTAFRKDGKNPIKSGCNGSDDSNSYMYPDNFTTPNNTYEVIELDRSDDDTNEFVPDVSAFLAPMHDITQNTHQQDNKSQQDQYFEEASSTTKMNEVIETELTIQKSTRKSTKDLNFSFSPTNPHVSSQLSPLLKPTVLPKCASNKTASEMKNSICNSETELYSEVTIQPLHSSSSLAAIKRSPDENAKNNIKQKSVTTLTPTDGDSIELYCLSLVDSFRAMTRSERERVKFEFAKILKDADYKDQL